MRGTLISFVNIEKIALEFLNGSFVGFMVIFGTFFLINRECLVELKELKII
tara:strand:- start:960 stop:1112 length:153 start_codon:yes stop_codon:yes gene_type:complete